MKKVKMFISALLLVAFAPSQVEAMCPPVAKSIPVHKKKGQLGTRADGLDVMVTLEQYLLITKVSNYEGIVNVYAYDSRGNLVVTTSQLMHGDGQCALDLATLDNGAYEVVIEFSNVIYVGAFEL